MHLKGIHNKQGTMESKTTIEVNGTQYDASTGTVIGVSSAPTLRRSGQNIDGFFRPRATVTPTAKTPAPVDNNIATLASKAHSAPEVVKDHHSARRTINHTKHHTPQAAESRSIHVEQSKAVSHNVSVSRTTPNHVHHHAVQRSRTLRRDAVPAPSTSTHNLLKPKGALQREVPGLITMKNAASNVDPSRLARAQSAEKSPLIARHTVPTHSVVPTFAPVSVQPTPSSTPNVPTPVPNNGDGPTVPSPQPTNKPTDIFEHALATANNFVDIRAHKTLYKKRARTHVLSMTVGSLALIVIASFIAYQNNPALQFKIASVKAGVTTSMPNLAAAGFSYNGVSAGNGKLTIGLKAANGSYQLTQANTNLSDEDMIQTVGSTDASGNPAYSVVSSDGTVIYRFSNTNATWVSGGEWYTVNGDAALSNAQVESLVQHT